MDIRQVVADNIRLIRQKRNLSQEALAAKSGVSISYIGYLERAEKSISVVTLAKIAKALKVQPEELLRK